jgi:hypothetical protein
MIEAFQEYYQYDFEKKKFLKRLPAFYKYLLNQVLLSLSWTSVDHEPLFPVSFLSFSDTFILADFLFLFRNCIGITTIAKQADLPAILTVSLRTL